MLLPIERYLKDNIDDQIKIEKWKDANKIPVFLRSIYKFHGIKVLGINCILLEIIEEAPSTDVINKHISRIKKITDKQIILYYRDITRYRRKSLIDENISFVIEDGQMFLPFLGLHLKNTDNYVEKEIKAFTPSAQIACLYFLYNKEMIANTTEFAKIFGWNLMTASRALNELYNATLLTYEVGGQTGRSKEYMRIEDPDYFKKASVFLSSPVKKVVYVKKAPPGSCVAGLEALSKLSMINPPNYKVRAINAEDLNNEDLEITKNKDIIKDENLVELQVWDYDPTLFTKDDIADTASLYLTLKEENDERIEQALEEILRGEIWYKD